MKKIFIIGFSLLNLVANAQEEPQVIIVREGKSPKIEKKKKIEERNVENYDAFKFDPFRMAIGELNFSWEHRLGEKTSFEVELGPTISNLRFFNTNLDFIHFDGTKPGSMMGYLASAGVRFYPTEDFFAMNKLYISPRIKLRQYNSSYSHELLSTKEYGYRKEVLFSFIVGTQKWHSNNFAFDYYAGLTIGSMNKKDYFLDQSYDGTTGTFTNKWRSEVDKFARFTVSVGMKVAIGN